MKKKRSPAITPSFKKGWFKTTVQSLQFDQNYLILTLRRPQGFQFEPGQYTQIQIRDEKELILRTYSIASPPSSKDGLEFCIQLAADGKGSSYFRGLQIGDSLSLAPPAGTFKLVDIYRPLVFVAGGSGISPLRSFLMEFVLQRSEMPKIQLIFGCREASCIPFRNELKGIAEKFPDRFTITWVADQGNDPEVLSGNPVTVFKNDASLTHPQVHYYLCGPAPMVSAVREYLISHSIPVEMIFSEGF